MLIFLKRTVLIVATVVMALALAGCGQSTKATAAQLQQSYAKATDPVREEVTQATAALQAGNYSQAISTLNRVAQAQPVDAAQKEAVGAVIQQTRKAVHDNPKLNTPELYKAMSQLITTVHGEN